MAHRELAKTPIPLPKATSTWPSFGDDSKPFKRVYFDSCEKPRRHLLHFGAPKIYYSVEQNICPCITLLKSSLHHTCRRMVSPQVLCQTIQPVFHDSQDRPHCIC